MTSSTLHRMGDAFFTAIFEAWEVEGPAIIERVRQEYPAAYLKLIASILPRPLAIEPEPLEYCTDLDLEALRLFLAGVQDSGGLADR